MRTKPHAHHNKYPKQQAPPAPVSVPVIVPEILGGTLVVSHAGINYLTQDGKAWRMTTKPLERFHGVDLAAFKSLAAPCPRMPPLQLVKTEEVRAFLAKHEPPPHVPVVTPRKDLQVECYALGLSQTERP
jgi:hypothetical protein